jgi:hypothetical protein
MMSLFTHNFRPRYFRDSAPALWLWSQGAIEVFMHKADIFFDSVDLGFPQFRLSALIQSDTLFIRRESIVYAGQTAVWRPEERRFLQKLKTLLKTREGICRWGDSLFSGSNK